jgi:hypothetical protein
MVFNATFNNISVISWWPVLLVEETGGPRETTDLSQISDKLDHIMLYTSPWSGFELTTSVVIGTDCIGSCKSNYHTTMTARWYECFYATAISFTHICVSVHQSSIWFLLNNLRANYFKFMHRTWTIGFIGLILID